MFASLLFCIAAQVQKSGARRLAQSSVLDYNPALLVLHAAHGRALPGSLPRGLVTYGSRRIPRVQLQMDPKAPDEGALARLFDWKPSLPDDWRASPQNKQYVLRSLNFSTGENVYGSFTAKFPPAILSGPANEMRNLISSWTLKEKAAESEAHLSILWKMGYEQRKYDLKKSRDLTAVGLIPNDPSMKYPWMLALASFSREQLKEDSMDSSLLKIVKARFGIEATRDLLGRDQKNVNVFAIQGLVEATDVRKGSAKVLLAKIVKWANIEKRLVVVAKDAVNLGDGTDLTEYYTRLGFESVNTGDGSYTLVYSDPYMMYDNIRRTIVRLKSRPVTTL